MKTLTVGVFHKEILSYNTPFCVNNFPLKLVIFTCENSLLAVVLIFDFLLGPALIDMITFSWGCSALLPLLHFCHLLLFVMANTDLREQLNVLKDAKICLRAEMLSNVVNHHLLLLWLVTFTDIFPSTRNISLLMMED